MMPPYNGPIWIDPHYFDWRQDRDAWVSLWRSPRPQRSPYGERPMPAIPLPPVPVDEERIRKIVREEIAKLPIPFDVPNAPPES